MSPHSESASITIRVATADDVDSLLALWAIGRGSGYEPQENWRRWVKPVS